MPKDIQLESIELNIQKVVKELNNVAELAPFIVTRTQISCKIGHIRSPPTFSQSISQCIFLAKKRESRITIMRGEDNFWPF